MSSVASGLLKKYEPLDTRDFVPFEDYDELSIDNIKDACERFYNAPQNTCDILASDRGHPVISLIMKYRVKKFSSYDFYRQKMRANVPIICR